MYLSIVIPAYNEEASILRLHEEIDTAIAGLPGGRDVEVIYIDDGSDDGTTDRLAEVRDKDPRVRVLRLSRNSGKSVAYREAFAATTGSLIATLDADLQDDPSELHKLIARVEGTDGAGAVDLAIGYKQGRMKNEPHKTIPSRFFNGVKRRMFGLDLHDTNCGFRVMHRAVAESLRLRGDHYRFIPELAHSVGFAVAEVPVRHRAREHGKSKYGITRFWTGLLDLMTIGFVTRFNHKPLHVFGTIGLACFCAGGGLETYVLARKLLGSTFQTHIAAIVVGALLIIVAAQLLALGLLAELVAVQIPPARVGIARRLLKKTGSPADADASPAASEESHEPHARAAHG